MNDFLTLGSLVVWKQSNGDFHYNNSQFHPAVVTKVHDDGSLNVFVMLDGFGGESQKFARVGKPTDDFACVVTLDDYNNFIAGPFPSAGTGD